MLLRQTLNRIIQYTHTEDGVNAGGQALRDGISAEDTEDLAARIVAERVQNSALGVQGAQDEIAQGAEEQVQGQIGCSVGRSCRDVGDEDRARCADASVDVAVLEVWRVSRHSRGDTGREQLTAVADELEALGQSVEKLLIEAACL
jgi:hypothetical protein